MKDNLDAGDDQMSSSSSSQHELDNDDLQHNPRISSNSLTSSSSSSCSLFENLAVTSSVNTNLSDLHGEQHTLKSHADTSELNKQQQQQHPTDNLNKLNYGESTRTTTFAKLAAAQSPAVQATSKINTTQLASSSNNSSNLMSKLNHLTSDKILLIRKEFKNNMCLLDNLLEQMCNQHQHQAASTCSPMSSPKSNGLDTNKLFQDTTASMLQNSATHQSIHLMMSINMQISSLVKQFNSPLSSAQINVKNTANANTNVMSSLNSPSAGNSTNTTSSTTTTSNNTNNCSIGAGIETKMLDTDLEIA